MILSNKEIIDSLLNKVNSLISGDVTSEDLMLVSNAIKNLSYERVTLSEFLDSLITKQAEIVSSIDGSHASSIEAINVALATVIDDLEQFRDNTQLSLEQAVQDYLNIHNATRVLSKPTFSGPLSVKNGFTYTYAWDTVTYLGSSVSIKKVHITMPDDTIKTVSTSGKTSMNINLTFDGMTTDENYVLTVVSEDSLGNQSEPTYFAVNAVDNNLPNLTNLTVTGLSSTHPQSSVLKIKIDGATDLDNEAVTYSVATNVETLITKPKGLVGGEEVKITLPYISPSNSPIPATLTVTAIDASGGQSSAVYNFTILPEIISGQIEYTTSGTFSFIVPSGVTAISAVLVGAGGGGHYSWANSAGGGGALAYANDIAVTSGETLTVVVPPFTNIGSNGAAAYLKRGTTTLFGADGGKYSATSESLIARPITGTVTPKGGAGGLCSRNGYGGGGGAGGYGTDTLGNTARGGDGLYGSPSSGIGSYGASSSSYTSYYGNGSNGAASGGVGYNSSTYGFGGGGGVGLLGRGESGTVPNGNGNNSFYNYSVYGGKSGSNGDSGGGNTNSSETINGVTVYHGQGGRFGGGGAGGGTSVNSNSNFCRGGQGAARIIWGTNRLFPSTNTQNM